VALAFADKHSRAHHVEAPRGRTSRKRGEGDISLIAEARASLRLLTLNASSIDKTHGDQSAVHSAARRRRVETKRDSYVLLANGTRAG